MTNRGQNSGIFRRKPIEQIETAEESSGLRRTLGLGQLTAIGIGWIIGAGIFSLAGAVANKTAGPAVLISFLIAGIASAAAAFSHAEFAGLIPRAGSAYTYGYAVLGEFAGWFIGWDLLLEYTAIVSVVAIGISGYLNDLLGFLDIELPLWMSGAPTVFFAVFGYDAMSTAAVESKESQKHMPKAILYSLAISMVLYGPSAAPGRHSALAGRGAGD